MTQDVERVVARLAAPPVTGVSAGARELMHEIMAGPPEPVRPRPRRRLPLRLAVPAGALLAAGAVAATWLLPAAPAAALDIKEENGYYVIQIKDLYANPKLYEQQLRALGLKVTLRVVPATAAYERLVFPTSPDHEYLDEIKGIYPPGPCGRLDGCPVGVKIPTTFAGVADIAVSRKARPGEKYQNVTEFNAKGEPLHCVPYLDRSVAEVRALLAGRGVRVSEYSVAELARNDDGSDLRASVPDDWHVQGGFLTEPGVATLSVSETPMDRADLDRYVAKYRKAYGCSPA
ncbi:hypothetical protein MF672_007000 [Actinomadura sp. ATCC 31491]|uniref:Uncharacterized protein n=1 Tax=Actinomadura luzonensis TaxID=2805427 RepID=A0ABT0FML8_9ACTN|nr:hypothetical protein [Actinomadura luzonensis]MCK2213542.1 hypothetical protein [Actinomadura luzonensis]